MKILPLKQFRYQFIFLILSICSLLACNNQDPVETEGKRGEKLSEEQKHLPENALKGLVIAPTLEVEPFAAEPMLQNPTNIDVDAKGRVWVTEAYNYRPGVNGNPTNALGDRIMILEDTNGDGQADTAKVFYQGPELNAPLGIAVLGMRVLVSQSPFVWAFYDDNGDDKADRKEILFQGIGGEQHDHGAHAFTFGPDGKLYFNLGNEGHTLKDKNGKPVLDQDGDEIGPKKYRMGMVFRCNPDGSSVECLGDNFRNPYEVAVDSYGGLWQSDNDDDGNKGTRINYIFPHGNYGYTDEMTGAYWQSSRTNMEDSIPFRHWHLNDPGVVPNMLQTGAGSPTGLIVYEGSLLPEQFHNQLIHCDAGPNVVRAYRVQEQGAGYSATIENILKGENDPWFRPADVAAAPDGSLIIADWYDPGVGGHAAGDQTRGRIYRVAPKAVKYTRENFDFTTASGAIKALFNANLAVRYLAFTELQKLGSVAIPELEKAWQENSNPRYRARALWVLLKMPGTNAKKYLEAAMQQNEADLRCMAIRASIQLKQVDLVMPAAVKDPAITVRREAALALHHLKSPSATEWWVTLASQYNGQDRWYLEALGIGADGNWDKFFEAWVNKSGNKISTKAQRDLVWRARTAKALPFLATLADESSVPIKDRLRYFRAFDFISDKSKAPLLISIITKNTNHELAINKLALHALDGKSVQQSSIAQKALQEVLDSVKGTSEYLELIAQYNVGNQQEELLKLAIQYPNEPMGRDAAGLLLKFGGKKMVMEVLTGEKADAAAVHNLLSSLGSVGSVYSVDLLQEIALSTSYPMPLRMEAASRIGHSSAGETRVLEILKKKKVPEELKPSVVASVSGAWMKSVRDEAASYLPGKQVKASAKPVPVLAAIIALTPDKEKGQEVFMASCALCHIAGSKGFDFGPNLTEIGSKLPREALYEAIIHPSAGIGFGYEGWNFTMKDGTNLAGILSSKTETDLEIKFPGGNRKKIKTSEVRTMTEMKSSMMTEGLYENMSNQDLANLLDWLSSLKKK